jgi:hypothetical protein
MKSSGRDSIKMPERLLHPFHFYIYDSRRMEYADWVQRGVMCF